MPVEEVIRAVNALDLKTFSLENVEILQRMLPTEQEVLPFFFFTKENYSVLLLSIDFCWLFEGLSSSHFER